MAAFEDQTTGLTSRAWVFGACRLQRFASVLELVSCGVRAFRAPAPSLERSKWRLASYRDGSADRVVDANRNIVLRFHNGYASCFTGTSHFLANYERHGRSIEFDGVAITLEDGPTDISQNLRDLIMNALGSEGYLEASGDLIRVRVGDALTFVFERVS